MEYICRLSGSPSWIGKIGLIGWNGTQIELDICGRGTQFHIIIGKHQNGSYLCIPNHGIGCELAALKDWLWNWEQISRYMGVIDACTIASGLCELEDFW